MNRTAPRPCLGTALKVALLFALAACVLPAAGHAAGGYGIAAGGGFETQSDANRKREVDGYVAIGVKWVRLDFDWAQIEQYGKGQWRWTSQDAAVTSLRSRGISVLGALVYTPPWARAAGTDKFYPPRNAADYADYVKKVVARYAPQGVKHWEIWNEPNWQAFWKPCPDPARYAALLKVAYAAIKSVDPTATVLMGGMAPAPTNGCSFNARPFLRTLYEQGSKPFFDAVSYHPYYNASAPPGGTNNTPWTQMYLKTLPTGNLRSIMEANGDGAKKIWGTETGAPIDEVSEATQASLLKQAFTAWNSYPWAGPLFIFAYRNLEHYGLVRSDWSRRPAWYTYQQGAATAP